MNRKIHLRNLHKKYENNGQENEAKPAQRIINAEALHEMYTKLRGLQKEKQKSKLKRIIVPEDPTENPKMATTWKVLDQQQAVEQTILNRNIRHFGQAQGTPFTVTPLKELVDFSASSPISECMLEGWFSAAELSDITTHVLKI